MNDFLRNLFTLLPEKAKFFRIGKCIYYRKKRNLNISLLVKPVDISKSIIHNKIIEDKIKKLLPEGVDSIEIEYVKVIAEENFIKSSILTYLYDEHEFIYNTLSESDIVVNLSESNLVRIDIKIDIQSYQMIQKNDLKKDLEDLLYDKFVSNFDINIKPFSENPKNGNLVSNTGVYSKPSLNELYKTIPVTQTEKIVGAISKAPICIKDLQLPTTKTVVLCGIVSNFKENISQSGRNYCSFVINDGTESIRCGFFKNSVKNYDAFKTKVSNDISVVCSGTISQQDSGRPMYFVKEVALCIINFEDVDSNVIYKDTPSEYKYVMPQPVKLTEQASFLDYNTPPPKLLEGLIVFFDLETTGIVPTKDRIVEIGAVKMLNGVLVESFECLVNPETKIPQEATNINGITNEMVVAEPRFGDVIDDFYKFCEGATMIAHNVDFDKGFLTYYAKKYSYQFTNEFKDSMTVAQQVLKKNVRISLDSLRRKYGLTTEGHHRAKQDAMDLAVIYKHLANEF